jgi:hypothetical protein
MESFSIQFSNRLTKVNILELIVLVRERKLRIPNSFSGSLLSDNWFKINFYNLLLFDSFKLLLDISKLGASIVPLIISSISWK